MPHAATARRAVRALTWRGLLFLARRRSQGPKALLRSGGATLCVAFPISHGAAGPCQGVCSASAAWRSATTST